LILGSKNEVPQDQYLRGTTTITTCRTEEAVLLQDQMNGQT